MKQNPLLAVLFAAMLVFLQSCNFPRPTPISQQNSATATALAMTQQAGGVPVTGGTGAPTTTTLAVQSPTPCRAGPGPAYPLVATLEPGAGFLVVGKNSGSTVWVIANPAGGTCWVLAKNAIISGDTSRLPVYPAPLRPTAAPSATDTAPAGGGPGPNINAPASPTSLYASRVCAKGFIGKTPVWVEDVVLTWQPSYGQQGYRIFRNNQPISAVTSDATGDNIQFAYPRANGGGSDVFGVAAFNASGASPQALVTVPGCP